MTQNQNNLPTTRQLRVLRAAISRAILEGATTFQDAPIKDALAAVNEELDARRIRFSDVVQATAKGAGVIVGKTLRGLSATKDAASKLGTRATIARDEAAITFASLMDHAKKGYNDTKKK